MAIEVSTAAKGNDGDRERRQVHDRVAGRCPGSRGWRPSCPPGAAGWPAVTPGVADSVPSAYDRWSPTPALHATDSGSVIDDSPSARLAVPAGAPPIDAVRSVASACGVIVRSAESLAFDVRPRQRRRVEDGRRDRSRGDTRRPHRRSAGCSCPRCSARWCRCRTGSRSRGRRPCRSASDQLAVIVPGDRAASPCRRGSTVRPWRTASVSNCVDNVVSCCQSIEPVEPAGLDGHAEQRRLPSVTSGRTSNR